MLPTNSFDTVPYEEIDVDVRGVVEFLNLFPGIKTISSCAGHEPGAEAYVKFTADALPNLYRLMRALPFIGARGALWRNEPVHESIYITADLEAFSLRVVGWPGHHVQRRLIGEIECCLANSLSGDRRPPFASGECPRMPGTPGAEAPDRDSAMIRGRWCNACQPASSSADT